MCAGANVLANENRDDKLSKAFCCNFNQKSNKKILFINLCGESLIKKLFMESF